MLRQLPPMLLKCAGVVGLAGAIVMVIASAFTPIEARLEAAPESRIAAAHEAAATQAAASSALVSDQVAVKAVSTGSLQQESPAAAEPPVPAVQPIAAAAAPEAAPLAIAAAPAAAPLQPEAALVAGPAGPQSDTADAEANAAEANCPPDGVGDADTQGPDGADCGDPANVSMPSVATALVGEPGSGNALEALSDEAADPPLDVAVPKPRPHPPAAAPARVVKTAARGRLPPPPNCGSKHAHWRYNSARQPVWYCR
jgi:hypothetical protein